MKLACASSALGREIESGELTQLEFLDLCARELDCDGVVLDVRHFPRTDSDYLAQIKKMATDWGLTIAALSDASLFKAERGRMEQIFDYAVTLGARADRRAALRRNRMFLDAAARAAERRDVACQSRQRYARAAKRAVRRSRAARTTVNASPRRLTPRGCDTDPIRRHSTAPAIRARSHRTRCCSGAASGPRNLERSTAPSHAFDGFRGFVTLDEPGEDAGARRAGAALREWREALCRAAKRNSTTDSVLPTR